MTGVPRHEPSGPEERPEPRPRAEVLADIAATRRAIDALATPVPAPDLTGSILARVERERGWLDRRDRRRVWVARIAAGIALVLAGGGVFLAHRVAPNVAATAEPTPVAELVDAVPVEASRALSELEVALTCTRAALRVAELTELDPAPAIQPAPAASVAAGPAHALHAADSTLFGHETTLRAGLLGQTSGFAWTARPTAETTGQPGAAVVAAPPMTALDAGSRGRGAGLDAGWRSGLAGFGAADADGPMLIVLPERVGDDDLR